MKTGLLPMLLLSVVTSSAAVSSLPAFSAQVDPSTLITKAEVEHVIGKLREAPKTDTGINAEERTCEYTNSSGAWVKVHVYNDNMWGMQKGMMTDRTMTPIASLGEDAFWVKRDTSTFEVYSHKGNKILEVDSSAGLKAAQTIAEKIAPKIR